jgi:hypothetical protein
MGTHAHKFFDRLMVMAPPCRGLTSTITTSDCMQAVQPYRRPAANARALRGKQVLTGLERTGHSRMEEQRRPYVGGRGEEAERRESHLGRNRDPFTRTVQHRGNDERTLTKDSRRHNLLILCQAQSRRYTKMGAAASQLLRSDVIVVSSPLRQPVNTVGYALYCMQPTPVLRTNPARPPAGAF